MNERCFVRPPWIESDGATFVVVTEAYHWPGHPRFGWSVHRTARPTFDEAVAYLARLGFVLVP